MGPLLRSGGALLLVTAAGAALRLVHYLDRRSLWLDEAMLALNVASRGFLELLTPLDYHQAAPLGFLWLERALVALLGPTELALRAPSLVAGVAVIPAAAVVGFRLFGEPAGHLAALLCALSPVLVRYSNEAKPYGTDALASLLLVGTAAWVAERPEGRGRFAVLAGVGLPAVLLSFPALFTAAAVVAALFLHPVARRLWRRTLLCGVLWVAPVAAAYLLVHRGIAGHDAQQLGYDAAFLVPGWLRERAPLAFAGTLLPLLFGDGSGIPNTAPPAAWAMLAGIAAGIVAGLVLVARRSGPWAAVLLIGPLVVCLLASALRRYPVGVPRMMAFTAPLLLTALAVPFARLAEALRPKVRPVVLAAAALLAVSPLAEARVQQARKPWKGEDAATLVEAFRERPRLQEPVYVSAKALPAWLFYTTNWESPHRERLEFYARAADGPSYDNAPPRGRPVLDEGGDNVFRYRSRRELLGLSPGVLWSWPTYQNRYPDDGWAANEAARIAREANPCAWLFFTHVSDRAHRPIYWQLRDHFNGKRDRDVVAPGGIISRICFPYTAEQLRDLATWHREIKEKGYPVPEPPEED